MSFWFALSHTVAHRTRNEGSRLCRLMCGGGSAPPELFTLITPGLRPALGRSPRFVSCLAGRAQPFRTSGGKAASRVSTAQHQYSRALCRAE